MKHFDVVVLGAGSAGEWFWGQLTGKTVAVIENGRVGGECPFVSCVPSKALLRSAQVRRLIASAPRLGATSRAVNLDDGASGYAAAVARRDVMSHQRDDTAKASGVSESGAELFRGTGRIDGPGRIVVTNAAGQEERLSYGELVISTGSTANRSPVPGLDLVPTWSSDEALSSPELPRSLAVLGGGPVGCELAQVYSAFGTNVTLIAQSNHLLPKEEPQIGETMAEVLEVNGVVVRTRTRLLRADPSGSGALLHFDYGMPITVDRVLLATGRHANVEGIGLESLGIIPDLKGLVTDQRCRVVGAAHVWAAGDVTGIASFTHTANYQARLVVTNLGGREASANYGSIPRVVYTDPPVAAVGVNEESARASGIDVRSASSSFSETVRANTDGTEVGFFKLIADASAKVLIGAAAIGPSADELIGEAALAIRARIPLAVWADVVHAFPTYSEAYDQPLRELAGLMV
jgi:pyruvate/2-oxoglutarate dehydrogenase complex dihydrolipoamide dehydrogenase (E3) component